MRAPEHPRSADPSRVKPGAHPWPDLAGLQLEPTLGTLHLWSQVVGKIRMMLTPWENHSWHVTLYVTARGLGTGLIPGGRIPFSMEFDLDAGVLILRATDGAEARVPLGPGSLARFHEAVMAALERIGISVVIDPVPCEIPDALAFQEDREERAYDPVAARVYWRALVQVHRVFQLFRTRFAGKCSPIHLFWGAFDLAVTRFSGRTAPAHPGGAPHMPDSVAREAYCQEVSSAGFWPGDGSTGGPCFYSYAYPPPAGFADAPLAPKTARFDPTLGEYLLSYADMIAAENPDAALLAFLQSTYEAAANLGGWDRAGLERPDGALGHPPQGS